MMLGLFQYREEARCELTKGINEVASEEQK